MAISPLPDAELTGRIERLTGKKAVGFTPVSGGYTRAQRFICRNEDGSTVFVKSAGNERTAGFLKNEILFYDTVTAPFVPRLINFEDHATAPILIIEDLSHCHWPPPWNDANVRAVVTSVREMHSTEADVRPYLDVHGPRPSVWARIADDPSGLLGVIPSLEPWLEAAVADFQAHEERCPTEGDALCHMDIRSDNLCIGPDRAILIDWNNACLGNPDLDLGFWLPSLCHEGGPLPEEILPHRRDIACWVAGFFAAQTVSSAERLGTAARIHILHRQQLNEAIAWAGRTLGLTPPKLD